MDDAPDTHEPDPMANVPHAGEPLESLSPLEQFRRLAVERTQGLEIRSRVRRYAASLLEKHGSADVANSHLPPDISINSEGTVRFDDQWSQDERWRDVVAAYNDELGDQLLPLLPPDTHVDAITNVVTVVTIDHDAEAWWI